MLEILKQAYESVKEGRTEEVVKAMDVIQSLSRTEEGVFDLTSLDSNEFQAGRVVYPIYAAFETIYHKKEGYPDILKQIRVWNHRLEEHFNFVDGAAFADILIHTIAWMSQEVYEYYRELVDYFRSCIKRIVKEYCQSGVPNEEPEAVVQFRAAVKRACEEQVLLTEKYQEFYKKE